MARSCKTLWNEWARKATPAIAPVLCALGICHSRSDQERQSATATTMIPALAIVTPPPIATEAFTNAAAAVARLEEIYERNTKFLRGHFEAYVNGAALATRPRAFYPFVRIATATHVRLDSRLAYGFVAGPGVHETTVTRPDLFRAYLTDQIRRLIENHGVPVQIGESNEPIAIHFAY